MSLARLDRPRLGADHNEWVAYANSLAQELADARQEAARLLRCYQREADTADRDLERRLAAEARVEELTKALATAGVPLEVLAAQIAARPYRELTASLQGEIKQAASAVRSALAGLAPSEPQDAGDES